MNRLLQKYVETVKPSLMKEFGYSSVMEAPKIVKVVVNMGVGDAKDNAKALEEAVEELTLISGQKPVITKAKKSIANFKIRENMDIGCKVTLRGERMYDFLDKLFNISLPRVRDFRGVSKTAFDGRGNYTLGVKEQLIFPEVDYDKVSIVRGMDVVVVTTAKTDEEAKALLEELGMPFEKQEVHMAKTSLKVKAARPAKFSTREYTRCQRCGRPHSVLRKYKLCRICFRELAYKGQIPGVRKASW